MQNSEKVVYRYRSARGVLKALFWLIVGPFLTAIIVHDIFHPSRHATFRPGWFWAVASIGIASMTIEQLTYLARFARERIVIEGATLTYYNWLGIRKLTANVAEITDVEKLWNESWRVFAETGRFVFSDKLNGYKDLVDRLYASGAMIHDMGKSHTAHRSPQHRNTPTP